jgi:hypothetical protein
MAIHFQLPEQKAQMPVYGAHYRTSFLRRILSKWESRVPNREPAISSSVLLSPAHANTDERSKTEALRKKRAIDVSRLVHRHVFATRCKDSAADEFAAASGEPD